MYRKQVLPEQTQMKGQKAGLSIGTGGQEGWLGNSSEKRCAEVSGKIQTMKQASKRKG